MARFPRFYPCNPPRIFVIFGSSLISTLLKKFSTYLLLLGVFLGSGFSAAGQFYYGMQQEFGKNRVQYNDFLWSYYRFERYDVYYYKEGKELAQFAAREVNAHLKEIEKYLDFPVDDRLQILVFNNMSDLKQSNINLNTEEDYNTGGQTTIVGTRMFVYFNGDHNDFIRQIRAGVAEIVIQNLIYGGSLKDAVRSSTLVHLPEWYTEGLKSFIAQPWNVEVDSRVRDGILSNKYKRFNSLTGEDARFAGHSFWNYVVNTYGEKVIPHILFMTIINRNVDSGFLFVLGSSLTSVAEDWMAYYEKRYGVLKDFKAPDTEELKKAKKDQVLSQFRFSPTGSHYAYVRNELGLYKVYLVDIRKDKKKKIIKKGYRIAQNTDYSYPLLTWHPTGNFLSMIYEDKGLTFLGIYDLRKKKFESRPLYTFNKITDISYAQDGRRLLLSAIRRGQTDVYIYDVVSNTFEQITNDIYDDHHPRFILDDQFVVFSSNRLGDSLNVPDTLFEFSPTNDLFWYDLKNGGDQLRRLTNTPQVNEEVPYEYQPGYVAYLSDRGGTRNRHMVHIDSAVAYVDTTTHYRYIYDNFQVTNFPYNIIQQSGNAESNRLGFIHYEKGRFRLNEEEFIPAEELREITATAPLLDPAPRRRKEYNFEVGVIQEVREVDVVREIDINNYIFGEEVYKQFNQTPEKPSNETSEEKQVAANRPDVPEVQFPKDNVAKAGAKNPQFKIPQARNYVTAFFTDFFTAQVDNSFINETYQPFTGGQPLFLNPSFNGLFKIGLGDLMENYKIIGAFRLSVDLNNNEFFLVFKDLKHRLDKSLILHRRGQRAFLDNNLVVKTQTHVVTYKVSWPFSEVFAVTGSGTYRFDQNVLLATDQITLDQPNFQRQWVTGKGTLVFDNTINKGLNLYEGSRWKIFGEYYQNLTSGGHTITAGFDFRKYTPVHRSIIWANRFAGGGSWGNEKLAYFMGGVDNWFSPRYNFGRSIDFSQNYVFQTLATPMRGFVQNIRNGTSFAVFNSELRIPVFRYLFNRPLRSDFLTNFQVVGFADVGTAWTGLTPYSEENFLNTETIEQGPITVNLNTQVEPIVAGYGFGLRTRMLGYFVKADWGWGWEDGVVRDSIFYISLGLDF